MTCGSPRDEDMLDAESDVPSEHERYEKAIAGYGKRFLGLEIDNPVVHSIGAVQGIKSTNWITILSNQWAGRAEIDRKMQEDSVKHVSRLDYDGGVILRSGSHPVLADRNRAEFPEAYRAVAGWTAAIRNPEPYRFHGSVGFDLDDTEAWIARLDPGAELP